jgi:hypothetical protein
MIPQGVMSTDKASNSFGLCPVKGQKPSLGTQTGSRGGVGTDKGIPNKSKEDVPMSLYDSQIPLGLP